MKLRECDIDRGKIEKPRREKWKNCNKKSGIILLDCHCYVATTPGAVDNVILCIVYINKYVYCSNYARERESCLGIEF
jgi:hypothetical protein